MNRSTCRSCGATIVWATNDKTLRTMPVDADPVTDGGNIILSDGIPTPAAHVLTKAETVDPGLFPVDGPRHLSHFVTCPASDEWRRK